MGFFDDVQETIDRGVVAAKGAVSTVGGEQLGFAKVFARMCRDGYELGYHESNGGNASYRLTPDDVNAARAFFYPSPSSWVPLGVENPRMAGEYLLVTRSGCHFRSIAADMATTTGIVELSPAGDAWRVVWGLKGGGLPTSEIAAHVAAFAARIEAGVPARVVYHAHPTALIAFTSLVEPDARTFTKTLWAAHTECVIAIPRGIGALGFLVPGSPELARATAEALRSYDACAWQLHGLMAAGSGFDEAIGLVSAVDKAADAYLRARAACGGSLEVPHALSDAQIRATATAYGLPINEDFLS